MMVRKLAEALSHWATVATLVLALAGVVFFSGQQVAKQSSTNERLTEVAAQLEAHAADHKDQDDRVREFYSSPSGWPWVARNEARIVALEASSDRIESSLEDVQKQLAEIKSELRMLRNGR